MTQEERDELIDAIEKGEIERNVSAYAQAFATERGLNPNTVRSAITRLRKEAGARDHRSGGAGRPRGLPAQSARRSDWFATTAATVLTEADLSGVAKVGAAALIRYKRDDEFKDAVDAECVDLEKVYEAIDELRNVTRPLGEKERLAIFHSLVRASE